MNADCLASPWPPGPALSCLMVWGVDAAGNSGREASQVSQNATRIRGHSGRGLLLSVRAGMGTEVVR